MPRSLADAAAQEAGRSVRKPSRHCTDDDQRINTVIFGARPPPGGERRPRGSTPRIQAVRDVVPPPGPTDRASPPAFVTLYPALTPIRHPRRRFAAPSGGQDRSPQRKLWMENTGGVLPAPEGRKNVPTISFAPPGLRPHAEDASVPTACAVGYDLPPATRANISNTLRVP